MRYDAKSARLFINGVEIGGLDDLDAPSSEFEGATEGPIEFSFEVRGKGEQRAARRSSRIWREARRLARGKP